MTIVRDLISGLLLLLTAVAIAAIAIYLSSSGAGASTCLSYREARAVWPQGYLSWRGHRCWFNPKYRNVDPMGKIYAKAKKDIDELENCCWPPLDVDANGNEGEPIRRFEERWSDQPWLK